jgi:cell division protein FtsZ
MDDLLPFDLPTNFASIIKVFGVGGGGSNAVTHMFLKGITGVDFVVANTDLQALSKCPVNTKVQLGKTLTEGLGAGNQPEVGREAAIESLEDIKTVLAAGTKMVFITAGMGGGTGTGGAPVIAQAAKEMGILTVGIVTIPFGYEGEKRIRSAIEGISQMEQQVDALLVINNEKIREIYGDLPASVALGKADEVLTTAAKGIAEIITIEGNINVDFADVKTVMKGSGVALMGTGEAEGEHRAEEAIKEALTSPLLDNTDIKGAKNILLNITSGIKEATLDEIDYINTFVQREAGNKADLIWGSNRNENLGDKIAVTIIATGFATNDVPKLYAAGQISKDEVKEEKKVIHIADKEDYITDDDKDEFLNDDNIFDSYNKEQQIRIKEVKKENASDGIERSHNSYFSNEGKAETNEVEFELVTSSESNNKINNNNEMQSTRFYVSNYQENLHDLEEVPAYKRKGIVLNNETFSEKDKFSRFTLSVDNGEISLNQNNSYLHDKAD